MKTHPLSVLAIACAVTLAITSCGNEPDAPTVDNDPTAEVAAPMDTTAADTTKPMQDTMASATETGASESASLGVLNAINDHEIAAGKQALAKGVTGDVAKYAKMMIDEHTKNRTETNALGPDANASDAQAQRQTSEQKLATLDSKNASDYASAYVAAMVKGHADALQVLDTKLIPSATRPEVKSHLTATRGRVAEHFEKAKELETAAR